MVGPINPNIPKPTPENNPVDAASQKPKTEASEEAKKAMAADKQQDEGQIQKKTLSDMSKGLGQSIGDLD